MSETFRATYTAFADGACTANGRPQAQAAWGVLITGVGLAMGHTGRISMSGPVDGCQTNNRAEITAATKALAALAALPAIPLLAPFRAPPPPGTPAPLVELLTDSRLVVGLLLSWYDRREAEGTLHELKNLDLVRGMIASREAVRRAHGGLVVRHVRGHTRRPPPEDAEAYRLWEGNDSADRCATGQVGRGAPLFASSQLVTAPVAALAQAATR